MALISLEPDFLRWTLAGGFKLSRRTSLVDETMNWSCEEGDHNTRLPTSLTLCRLIAVARPSGSAAACHVGRQARVKSEKRYRRERVLPSPLQLPPTIYEKQLSDAWYAETPIARAWHDRSTRRSRVGHSSSPSLHRRGHLSPAQPSTSFRKLCTTTRTSSRSICQCIKYGQLWVGQAGFDACYARSSGRRTAVKLR